MNKKMVFYMLGRIILLEGVLLVLPAICSLIYREESFWAFLITIGIALICGGTLTLINRTKNNTIFAKEGFVIVALAWISLSAIGALPFVLGDEIPSFTDAFFETVSGFTTTGSSIIPDVEACSKGMLFWRSFTHWVGGMGVLVLFMAIFPTESGRTIHIMRAEMPGPIIGKLVPKIKSTAKILYIIYIALTLTEIALLLFGGMSFYQSVIYSMGTAGTGGFVIDANGLADYTAYQQWVITIFMLIFGVNFNIYYLILMRKIRSAFKSEELWSYILIVAVAVAIITGNIYSIYGNLSDSLRNSAFQVASIISTTGYASADFNLWPNTSKAVLLLLMFIGACAGSTAGGFKVSRVVIVFKSIKAKLREMLHTRSVSSISFEGKTLDDGTISHVLSYLAIYCFCIAIIFIVISLEPFSLETNISAVVACFNNIGPGLDKVGPMSNFSAYSDFSKYVLSFAMLLGRLEIYPLILLFSPSVWKSRSVK